MMIVSTSMDTSKLALLCGFVFFGWVICLYTYRLTFHPLAKFPGPKLAAATRWYEFYYDVVLKGQYVFYVQELHKSYGPIIRISPEELHIDDPEFFDTLYAKSGRLHKHARDEYRFGNPRNLFATADANTHRLRRTAVNPFFSKRNVVTFQKVIHDIVNRMTNRIAQYRNTGKPLTISFAYMAMVGDVILEYCFGYNFNHVESEGFQTNFHEMLHSASQSGLVGTHLPFVMKLILSLPEWFVVWSTPMFALLFKLHKSVEKDVKSIRQRENETATKRASTRPNVIQFLMRSETLPPEEKTDLRLLDEGANFVGAGVTTTGWTLSVATFHIINNRSIYHKLRQELEETIPDTNAIDAFEWTKLEQCQYLTACIKEAIRLSYATSARLTRLSDNLITYDRWLIPPNTPVGMTIVDISHNEGIFPNSELFDPKRWLPGAKTKTGEPVEKYWVGFGRGTRNCLGINLAWLMLYVNLACVFRNFDFELYETDESDVQLKHDFMVPSPRLDSKGVRVLVKG